MTSPNAVPPRNSLRGQERSPMSRSPFQDASLRGAESVFFPRSRAMPTSRQMTPITKMVAAHCMPGPRANVSRSMSVLLRRFPGLLVLPVAAEVRRGGSRRDADRCRAGERGRIAPVRRRQRLVEAALVPEVRLRAAQAAVPRLDREARAGVPLDRGARVVRRGALAAELVQAPAAARTLVVEG